MIAKGLGSKDVFAGGDPHAMSTVRCHGYSSPNSNSPTSQKKAKLGRWTAHTSASTVVSKKKVVPLRPAAAPFALL